MIKKLIAIGVCATIVFGPAGGVAPAAAAQGAARRGGARIQLTPAPPLVGALPVLPGLASAAASPRLTPGPWISAQPQTAAARAAAASAPVAAPRDEPATSRPFARSLAALRAPAIIDASPRASAERSRGSGQADFDVRLGAPAADSEAVAAAPTAGPSFYLPAASRSRRAAAGKPVTSPPKSAEHRSAYFTIAAAVVGLAAVAAVHLGALFLPAATGQDAGLTVSWLSTAVSALNLGVIVGAAALAAAAVVDVVSFALAVARGGSVTDQQFAAFVRSEVAAGRVDASLAALIRPFRPKQRFQGLSFGFAAGGFIYLRPELAVAPWLFRAVLVHEHHHLKALKTRGPPTGGGLRGLGARIKAELAARLAELRGPKALKAAKIPVLERALRQAELSLELEQPFDVLVINPGSHELQDPSVYGGLSRNRARVSAVTAPAPQEVLAGSAARYRAVVIDKAGAALPAEGTPDAVKLNLALRQLDSLYVLSARGMRQGDGGFSAGTDHARRYDELVQKAHRVGREGKGADQLEKQIQDFWRQLASTRLSGMGVTSLVGNLYDRLQNKGIAFLSFDAADGGIGSWERLLRYWEADDGGQFRVTRVDLEDGAHILVLRKVESRVGLWLQPQSGKVVRRSVADAMGSPESRAAARQALTEAGFGGELVNFDELGLEIEQVMGADVGRQEIYVTIPRRMVAAMRRYVITSGEHHIRPSRGGFMPQLNDAPKLHSIPPVWKMGVTGADESILWIDTGGDATHEDFAGRLDRVDMVHEGPEDWMGHGTHVAGISISGGGIFTGIARGARGIMAKVFGRDTPGASDGPIMGAGTIGHQRGVSVISASLGVRGNAASNLTRFFSELVTLPNGKGEHTLFVGSAGNAGPVDRSLSSPGNAKNGLTIAAATKSLDDGVPEPSFFSSIGPDEDPSYSVPRLVFKPDIAMIGGDVVTDPGDPNVYKLGVTSAKSKDMPVAYADTPDGRHTSMAGTSMAAPMAAGLALLVRSALRRTGAEKALAPQDIPLAIKAIMIRTSDDMGVPPWINSGLGNGWAAIKMVLAASGEGLRARLSLWPGLSWLSPHPGAGAFAWIARYKAVLELEDKIYRATALSKSQAQARFEETATDDLLTPIEGRAAMGNAVAAEAFKTFSAERAAAVPALIRALKDSVWLVRRQAAFTLLNMRSPEAAMELAEVALHDEEPRVRQMAFLALAETPTHAVDLLLQKASADTRWDVALYAAYALARRGDAGGLARIRAGSVAADKRTRLTAVWLSGQLRARASAADAEALSNRVIDAAERGYIRHFAAIALSNLAADAPDAISDKVILDLLGATGPQNLALTRTIAKFFPVAAESKQLSKRLAEEPLRAPIVDFIRSNKAAVLMPGALGELVQLLARLLDVPLDDPTPVLDASGQGVAGVDPLLGPLDVVIKLPPERAPRAYWDEARGDPAEALARAGLDADALRRLEARPRAALPLSQALWLSVPAHKLYAFGVEMERLGLPMHLSGPRYSAAGGDLLDPSAGSGGGATLTLETGGAGPLPTAQAGADLSFVRVRAGEGASEARVLAALESVHAAARPLEKPTVVSIDAAGALARGGGMTLLAALAGLLMLHNVGVVVPAGNEGPRLGSVTSPVEGGLAVVVAAASRAAGLEHYSSRGRSGEAPISWTDIVEEPSAQAPFVRRGTGAAAESSAAKMAAMASFLAEAYARAGRPLPPGWFFLVRSAVERSLSPMADNAAHEVGGGLFVDPGAANALLARRLENLDQADREARTAMDSARQRWMALSLMGPAGFPMLEALRAVGAQASGPAGDAALKWTRDVLSAAETAAAAPVWWRDRGARRLAVTLPLYSLRRASNDPGIGKFSDLGRYYREVLAKKGVDTVLLLPHFAVSQESPYAPVSLHAANEDHIDWSQIDEVRGAPELAERLRADVVQYVDYASLRTRESGVARRAYELFKAEQLGRSTERARSYAGFVDRNKAWLDDYAEYRALSALIGKPSLEWTDADVARARAHDGFQDAAAAHRYAQWNAALQLKKAIDDIHAAGGRVLFDMPMFRAKNSVDAWRHPEYFTDLKTRNPGIENQWTHENWGDLALWNWTKLKAVGYAPALEPYRYWLDFGFDGARADALHFAYAFGNGQLASGDEPGDAFVGALAGVFGDFGALPLAEALEGLDAQARRFGFLTVGGDWKPFSGHDDPRRPDFLETVRRLREQRPSGDNSLFVSYTLGDEWADPFSVKELRDGRSLWHYRIPLQTDADYSRRAVDDFGERLRSLVSPSPQEGARPPPTRRDDSVIDDYHGTKVADPYRWLEDADSEETKAWVDAQNAYSAPYLRSIPEREELAERLKALFDHATFSAPIKRGRRWFYLHNPGLANQDVLYKADRLYGERRVLLDPNEISQDGTTSLAEVSFSEDGRYLAYALSEAGSDWNVWRVRDVETGEDLPDEILWSKFSDVSWLADGSGFYYVRYPQPKSGEELTAPNLHAKIYFHKLGTTQADDVLVLERPEHPTWGFSVRQIGDDKENGRYLIVEQDEGTEPKLRVWIRDLLKPDAPLIPLFDRFDAFYSIIDNDGPIVYVQTTKDAPRGKLVAVDINDPAPEKWRTIIPQAENRDVLKEIKRVGKRFVAVWGVDAHDVVRVYDANGGFEYEVALPTIGSVSLAEESSENGKNLFITFSSFNHPETHFHLNLESGKLRAYRRPRVPVDPKKFEVKQVFYASKDGTRVPMFIVHKKGLKLDGSNPTYLWGYGGFGVSEMPEFSEGIMAWVERGGVFALPNIRGGGEYGQEWHDAGRWANKQDVFDDFIAAAEYLISEKYTSAPRLGIGGGSNGGLLVGAVMTQRPELFGAAVPQVGVLDMLRYHLFTVGRGWTSEYDISEDPEGFARLIKYSPLHNVKSGTRYPATLVMTGDHDDRVVPAHSHKFTAALQAAQAGEAPILTSVEKDAGHDDGMPTSKLIESIADRLAFLLRALGVSRKS